MVDNYLVDNESINEENSNADEKEDLTRKQISKIILRRYYFTSYTFVIFFMGTLVLNIILSIYVDDENFYRFGPKTIHWGLSISDSMTGNISKPVALLLIFISALYLLSLIQFQFIFFKILIGQCLRKNEISFEIAEKIWLNNRLANSIANLAVIFLAMLTIFDTWKFHNIHQISAFLFFISIITYLIFRRKIELIVIDNQLVGEVQKKHSWVLYLIFILFICFVVGFAYINLAVKREDRFEDYYLPWLIFIVAFEYLLCLFCVYNFATNVFVQEKIMNQCDFKELLHLKMFCLISIFANLLCIRRDIPTEIL